MKVERLNRCQLEQTLDSIKKLKICLLGDVCVDVYWFSDMKKSILSRETPHFPLPVVQERFSLGSGGNVAANMAALNPKELRVVSVIGSDWRASLVRECLAGMGLSDSYLVQDSTRCTPAYCKPFRKGISHVEYEDPRIDFDNYQPLLPQTEQNVLHMLEQAVAGCDILVVCDQNTNGVVTDTIANAVCQLGNEGKRVVVDSRERVARYHDVIVKPNELEAALAVGKPLPQGRVQVNDYQQIATLLSSRTNRPAVVTLGGLGALWAEDGRVTHVPTQEIPPPIDIVGAGDTFLSGFGCAYAAGLPGPDALAFANLCSGITVKKIGQTGVATPQEILSQYQENTR